jgi:hypothetical protein
MDKFCAHHFQYGLLLLNFHYIWAVYKGDLAQLVRACDSQSQGRGFDSLNLHQLITLY